MKLFSVLMVLVTLHSAQAEWKLESINNVQVHYYLPKKSTLSEGKNSKRALMVNLHGCAQKAEDLKKDGNWDNTADDYNMIVAIPKVPNGGVYSGCWDYYGTDHTRANRDNSAVLSLVKGLLEKSDLDIDPAQVYVSGLSSGGGESMILGCLAPEIFAGIGLNAGPSTGTSANEISKPTTTYQTMLATCKKLGATQSEAFKTQLTSIIYGNNDYIVSTTYNTNNAEIMRTMYEANIKSTFDTKKLDGTFTDGTGTLWSDAAGPRVSLIMNTNLGHNWPAGQGGNGGSFINKKSINYPAYLTEFFFANNRRAKSVTLPEVLVDPIENKDSKFVFSGEITVPASIIQNMEVFIRRKSDNELVDRFPVVVGLDNRFSALSKSFPDGQYDFDLEVKNSIGTQRTFKRSSWIGEVAGVNMPQLINTHFQSIQSCVVLTGQAVNNGASKIIKVVAVIDGEETFETGLENTQWEIKTCEIKDGKHTILIHAENVDGMSSNFAEFSFVSSKNSATATVQEHMEAKRLKWEQYGYWYLKYGDERFTIYLGADNVWSDKAWK